MAIRIHHSNSTFIIFSHDIRPCDEKTARHFLHTGIRHRHVLDLPAIYHSLHLRQMSWLRLHGPRQLAAPRSFTERRESSHGGLSGSLGVYKRRPAAR